MKKTMEEVRKLSRGYKKVPISYEILSDVITPINLLIILKNVSSNCYILESVEKQKRWGRYTFLGYDPLLNISVEMT